MSGRVTKVNLPKSGMGIEEGTIARWLKAVGERVSRGEVIVEVETAKALQEVEAPASGTLVTIIVAEGMTTPFNTALAEIQED
jgi:pyruvate/2-oxoglutarate dehydrogenase complex dihydrolipoamide acyltransferase (E2) component